MQQLRDDLQRRGLTQTDIALRTGYKSRQAIAAMLNSDQYLSRQQAVRFNQAFGYSMAFMTEGNGQLGGIPENALKGGKPDEIGPLSRLPEYDHATFDATYRNMMDRLIEEYGMENLSEFLSGSLRYLQILAGTDPVLKRESKRFFAGRIYETREELDRFEEMIKMQVIGKIYDAYKMAQLTQEYKETKL